MLYIGRTPTNAGNYDSLQSTPAKGLVKFPEEYLSKYIELNGFVKLTIGDNVVTAVRANNAAREAWLAKRAEQEAEAEAYNTGNDAVTWAELDAAYNEGRDTAYDE